MQVEEFTPVSCESIPENLEPGKLYISEAQTTAAHLCPCGCGCEVVLPFVELGRNPGRNYPGAGGRYLVLTKPGAGVFSFAPSFNPHRGCRYFITRNKVCML
jgi:hypothetical protein